MSALDCCCALSFHRSRCTRFGHDIGADSCVREISAGAQSRSVRVPVALVGQTPRSPLLHWLRVRIASVHPRACFTRYRPAQQGKFQPAQLWLFPTEPIGSIPRPLRLIEAVAANGDSEHPDLEPLYETAIRETVERFEATGSPVITDGEQRKYHDFWTYCVHGLPNTAPDGFRIPFAAGHTRRMPRLTGGPFRYQRYADSYLDVAITESRIAMKIDPSGNLLNSFIDLNNLALSRFSAEERKRIGCIPAPGTVIPLIAQRSTIPPCFRACSI